MYKSLRSEVICLDSPAYVKPNIEDRVAWHEFQKFWSKNTPNFNAIRKLPQNKVVPFVGAGLTSFDTSVYPLWERALKNLANELGVDDKEEVMPLFEHRETSTFCPDTSPSLYFIAKVILEKMGAPTLYKHLCGMFSRELLQDNHRKALAEEMLAISLLPKLSNYCLTVNLDTVLEFVYDDKAVVKSPVHKGVKFNRHGQGDKNMIIKLHGVSLKGLIC